MFCKVHDIPSGAVLACCDCELLGKTLEEEGLSFTVKDSFYGGARVSEKTLLEMLGEAESANIVGERCVGAAQRTGLINASGIRYIAGVPHAQFFRI